MKASLIVPAVMILFNFYIVLSIRNKLPSGFLVSFLVGLLAVSFVALQLVAPLVDWSLAPIDHQFSGALYEELVRASYLAIGIMSCLLVFSMVADIAWFVVKWIAPRLATRTFSGSLLVFVYALTAASLFVGLSNAGKTEIVRVDVPIKGLGEVFDGFKIVQISDLHIGPHLRKPFVEQIVDQVAAEKPDMIVLTGDIADGKPEWLSQELSPLAMLDAPFGKLYVPGNHEYYWGAKRWIAAMEGLGFQALLNTNIILDRSNGVLLVGGVPDRTALRLGESPVPDFEKAAAGASALATRILLSHQPKSLDKVKQAGFALQISGHTHAGQYFPFTWIIPLFEPYTHGLYDLEGLKLYVSKGAGFWGPPLRSGGPGEITLLTLRVP
jgi:predicted MPP superfamily phosphohydrolase